MTNDDLETYLKLAERCLALNDLTEPLTSQQLDLVYEYNFSLISMSVNSVLLGYTVSTSYYYVFVHHNI